MGGDGEQQGGHKGQRVQSCEKIFFMELHGRSESVFQRHSEVLVATSNKVKMILPEPAGSASPGKSPK